MQRVIQDRDSTGANRGNEGRNQNLCSLRSLLLKSGPLLAVGKLELREYKAVYVQSDAEIGLSSDEVVVNCAP
jgi:hypothetical protein